MRILISILIISFGVSSQARIVEDGFGFHSKKTVAETTYQKWVSFKAKAEKKIRVFFGMDNTAEIIEKKIAAEKAIVETKEAEQKALVQSLPTYTNEDNNKVLDKLSKQEEKVAKAALYKEVSLAVPADVKLKKDKAGVAYLDLETKQKQKNKIVKIKITDIPLLNIGKEKEISASDLLLDQMTMINLAEQKIESLKSPELFADHTVQSWMEYKIEEALYVELQVKTLKSLGLNQNTIEKIVWATKKDVVVDKLPVDYLSKEENRLLQAMILDDHKACHSALGLYYPLQNSKNKLVEKTSTYRTAMCNHSMGFFHQSIDNLLDVMTDEGMNKEARVDAYKTLVKNLPYEHEIKVGNAFLARNTKGISDVDQNAFYYYIAKSMLRQKKYDKALQYSIKVTEDLNYYPKAQYAAAVSEHLLGKSSMSLKRQRDLLTYIDKKSIKDKNVKTLVELNLARYAFQNKKMSESIEHYRAIDRNHPLWMDSLKELGWAQLISTDEPGAIGNMHSLHSPFFKKVYKPDSHAIRSIGYLNLCHYGDAYRSLSMLEQEYRPYEEQINTYLNKYKSRGDSYITAKTFLKSDKGGKVRGLTDKIVREAVRKRDFLNKQEHINHIYEEGDQYKFVKTFVQKDAKQLVWLMRKNTSRIKDYKAKVSLAKKDKKYYKNLLNWTRELEFAQATHTFYLFKKDVLKESLSMYSTIQKRAYANLNKVRKEIEQEAGALVRDELKKMKTELKALFRNNEFLRYEVFAGAGENIRFHVAGRDVESKRLPASAQPQSKDLKWNYDGEFWQDEVGFYRSTLKSNCPKR